MKKLNKQQRKFLEYLRDNHNCLGYCATIPDMLESGEYDNTSIIIHDIVKKFQLLRDNETHQYVYSKPTKYLNS